MKVGFIGLGNMGSAFMKGVIRAGKCETIGYDVNEKAAERAAEVGVETVKSACEAAEKSDVLFLTVKPQYYESVIAEIKDSVRAETIVVTVAPGKTLLWLSERFNRGAKIVRTMPNTPAMIGEGMIAVCPGKELKKAETDAVMALLSVCGRAEIISEDLIDAVVGISGSSPAYFFMMIEAMADAGVAEGLPRDKAYIFAEQAMLGSAKLALETGKHPGELKDMVTSPRGTTIEAVQCLEQSGFRAAVTAACRAAAEKSREM
ncbi:MAG: pyrroline-5-carboxylate reductase [Eubacteriales bacterium]|nr:pyrroline-5-carboxylate reductase [Eubacteriales bacterium]MDD3880758.1 pyrroline-5-carboxylate reductase [Eubacteriales bacterium]MDD3882895.1 pyrroline-5-carboxylate reductase [Eubacteriales bacterium]MDD4511609.1 pyrroline-5-carboxylate reductase [Eubacteriales bacterium]